MTKSSKKIFTEGKEKVLREIFTGNPPIFGYIALGYASEDNGFESTGDFKELEQTNGYNKRIKLEEYLTESPEVDEDTGKVLIKFTATIGNDVLIDQQNINQIAVVDNENISADTEYYCATTFPTFTKTSESSITFVLGFRI